MADKNDYYDSLGVRRDATEEDIRRAFRKKAMEFHPDRNKDPSAGEHFREVNEAYQVLGDPERRRQYDRFGHAGVSSGASGPQAGAEGFGDLFGGFGDIFDAFFGGDPFGGAATGTRTRARPGRDLQVTMSVSFDEAAFGVGEDIEVTRVDRCTRCEGSRSEPGSSSKRCDNCGGTGRVRRAQRSIFGQFVQEAACNVCGGAGETVTTPCTQCKGAGKERVSRQIHVEVPPGVEEGIRLQLRGQGDAGDMGGPAGDLYVMLHVEPHRFFRRHGDDILYDLELSFPQAALGDEVEVPTLEGSAMLKIPAGTQPEAEFRLKGQGMPHLGRAARRGDEVITAKVATPEKLNKEQRALLEQLQRSLGSNGSRGSGDSADRS